MRTTKRTTKTHLARRCAIGELGHPSRPCCQYRPTVGKFVGIVVRFELTVASHELAGYDVAWIDHGLTQMTEQQLLDDRQMSAFLTEGYVLLHPTELPQQLHEKLFAAAAQLYDEARLVGGSTTHLQYLGDNVLARIPELNEVLDAPTVTGALASILGDGYVLHPHHFVHSAGRADQGFHQDGNLPWNTRGYFRSHRPISAMLFYYPQTVTDDMGPTEVLPGTQYWSGDFEGDTDWQHDDHLDRDFNATAARAEDLAYREERLQASLRVLPFEHVERRRLTVPAGSVVIANYDLVHRGTRQGVGSTERRFMYKFYFLRTHEPRSPSWQNSSAIPDLTFALPTTETIIARVWSWLRGEPTHSVPLDNLVGLMAQLHSPSESVRRAAGYALGDAGSVAVDSLVQALVSPVATVRRMAAFALGETRCATMATIAALIAGLGDADELVRSNSAFSLGSLARVARLPSTAIEALLTRLGPQCEPDNTNSANMSRSTVRECVMHALLQVACNGQLDDGQRQRLAALGLADPDRYVRGLTVQALRHSPDATLPDWLHPLLRYLDTHQYSQSPG